MVAVNGNRALNYLCVQSMKSIIKVVSQAFRAQLSELNLEKQAPRPNLTLPLSPKIQAISDAGKEHATPCI